MIDRDGGKRLDVLLSYVAGLLGKEVGDVWNVEDAEEGRKAVTEKWCWALEMFFRFTFPSFFER